MTAQICVQISVVSDVVPPPSNSFPGGKNSTNKTAEPSAGHFVEGLCC